HRTGPRAVAARLLRLPPEDRLRTPAHPGADRRGRARRTLDAHHPRGRPMLMRLLRTHLRAYSRPLLGVVALQFAGTMASLYLPSLNADIIDRGIAVGDTGHILEVGGWMLVVTFVQIVCSVAAVYLGARTA